MTPEELADRYPKLYHVTEAGASPSIQKHGLHSAKSLIDLFEIPPHRARELLANRRPQSISIRHPLHGTAVLNDNIPLNETILASCLDDGIRPDEWLMMLNTRVFFFTSKIDRDKFINARGSRFRKREIMVVDTLKLAEAYAEEIQLCPINSGVTFRKPARRGLSTFSPLLKYSYHEWTRLRADCKKTPDTIKELVIVGMVNDIQKYVDDVLTV